MRKLNKITFAVQMACAASAMAVGTHAYAQESQQGATADDIEVIQVSGIRGSTVASINTKRFAGSMVDGIAAEDIGKLPDITIAESLQRITGVQIQRVAGEGGPVQIRGLPQVDTMLNGEVFLSATTIDSSTVDFTDLPSQLFSGVDVYKSSEANSATAGISGAIDLRTRRPFDMDEGLTFSGGAELSRGSISEENNPSINGLVAYNNGKVGILFTAVSTDVDLATDYNGYFDTSENGGIGAANNNFTWGANPRGDETRHVVPQGFAAFNKQEERNRKAFQLSAQADLGEGFELTFDAFYTDQSRFNHRSGLSQNNRWYTFNDYAYPTADGYTGDTFTDANGDQWGGVNAFNLRPWRLQTFTQANNNFEESENYNLELNYDNGGPLSGQVRMTRARATASMRHGYGEGDLLSIDSGSLVTGPGQFSQGENCVNGEDIVGDGGGCFAQFSPGGIADPDFILTYDASGAHPVFGGFDQLVNGGMGMQSVAAYMADINSYHIGAFSSEGNTDDEGEINTFSTKWNYALDHDYITSVDFGVRHMERIVDHDQFTYTSEFGDGCDIAQWKAVDQYHTVDTCEGNPAAGEYLTQDVVHDGNTIAAGTWVPYTLLPPTRLDEHTTVMWQDNFGPVSGIPGMWAIDPNNFRDPRQFHLNTFGNVQRIENAGASYDVSLEELSYFAQLNFETEKLRGNVGLRVIETDLYVKQNLVGSNLPHSGLGPDTGDVVTERSYTDYLPSVNLAYSVTEDVILRGSYSKNMMALDLSQWGGGKTVGKTIDGSCDCLRVRNGTLTGNPDLNPWRSENMSFSAEWYAGTATMLFATYFDIEIESFTAAGEVLIDEPDDDGIRRGPWPFSTSVQGNGGNVSGIELGAKVAFSDVSETSTFLDNMGVDVNYTYTDSEQDNKDVFGNDLPFVGMSKDTYNFVLWYEDDNFSTRIAWNSRSPRLITQGSAAVGGQSLYQDDYSQLDISFNYNVNEDISVYVHGANITEEFQQTYLEFPDQKAFQNVYEARWILGTRINF
ncbi:TonB-dependent receptor [Alteromonas sp. KUL49]|uniref:TonB-dependent receptor n=1 Tax=Alteromonas sp. KUL49 TaxID=2480798 RepID=UPI00102F1F7C|nr:TonB-dependent receptor [Alteromonas sp. KUL49]TAP35538.1 TonB-dependent receptor [Alteromonas sp. KUL49]GEA13420.1 TonB-dependent receptor [Alteromonas sp. KUL49]